MKLQLSGGNVKAVQGDTGHAQARMVTDLYAHADTEDRRLLAQKVEQQFFQRRNGGKAQNARIPVSDCTDDTAFALKLLQNNPDMAKLIVAALGHSAGT